MKQLLSEENLIGKTISSIVKFGVYTQEIFMFFEDETFCIIRKELWDDSSSIEISDDVYDLEPNLDNYLDLFELGFIDSDKFNEMKDKEVRLKERNKMDNELKMLHRLAEKYGKEIK